jgi:S-methylmethionine-dependent homocysteine/selenocysteine methylase
MYHWVDYFSFETEINRVKRKIKLDRIKRQNSRKSRIDRDNKKEIEMKNMKIYGHIDGYNGIYYNNYSNHSDWLKAISASYENIKDGLYDENVEKCIKVKAISLLY